MNRLRVEQCFRSMCTGDSILVFVGQGYCHRVHSNETHLVLVSYDNEGGSHELLTTPLPDTIPELFYALSGMSNY